MTCHFACRSSQKYKKIENFIIFPLLKATTTKISQCLSASVCILFSYFIVKVVLYKKKRGERQKKYFFYTIDFCFRVSFYIFLPF